MDTVSIIGCISDSIFSGIVNLLGLLTKENLEEVRVVIRPNAENIVESGIV